MSFEGIWLIEVLGPYGWQEIGTAFMRKGRYLAAGADHHAVGSFTEDGDKLQIDLSATQHGKTKTVFGENKRHIAARIEAKLKKADKITGKLRPAKSRKYDLSLRMARVGSFD